MHQGYSKQTKPVRRYKACIATITTTTTSTPQANPCYEMLRYQTLHTLQLLHCEPCIDCLSSTLGELKHNKNRGFQYVGLEAFPTKGLLFSNLREQLFLPEPVAARGLRTRGILLYTRYVLRVTRVHASDFGYIFYLLPLYTAHSSPGCGCFVWPRCHATS